MLAGPDKIHYQFVAGSGLGGINMTEGETSRRALIKTALAGATLIGPLGLLAACKDDTAPGNALTVIPDKAGASFAATAAAKGAAEIEYWRAAIGATFKVSGSEGPMYGVLTSVTALAVTGERPAALRAQPMVATFTFDRGYKPVGDDLYTLARGSEASTMLYLQRGGTVEAPTLIAQFN